MDKSVKKNRLAKAKAEEEALNSILWWFVGGCVLEFLLFLLNRYWVHYRINEVTFRADILGPAVKVLAFVLLAAAAAATFWWKKENFKKPLPLALSLVSLGASAGCFGAWLVGNAGIAVMITVVPGIVVLAILYYLYQREFFLIAALSALSLLGIWLCSHGMTGRKAVLCWIYVLCALVLIGAVTWGCSLCQKADGAFTWKGKKLQLLSKDANYLLIFITAGVAAALLLCAALSLPAMALYAVAVAWLLVMAVYYTVKII